MFHDRRHPAFADQSGQVLVLAAVAMVMLLAVAGFALDIGHAYLVQRQLQAGVDAAALAGAQHLPLATDVVPVAQDYGPSPGARNATTTVSTATTTVTMRCVQSAPGCQQASGNYNAVRVDATAPVRTLFGRVIGINSIRVKATATACSPCTAKPLDIMLVLDRTGSMCQHSNGSNDPACTDLNNAKSGMRTFLSYMDPTIDWVGLSVFPPALGSFNASGVLQGDFCRTPTSGSFRYGYDAWWPYWDTTIPSGRTLAIYGISSITNDFLVQQNGTWISNPSSDLNVKIGCVGGNGTTSYSNSIDEAQHEFGVHGRGNVQDVMIFLSDGAANTTPRFLPNYMDTAYNRLHPCHAGIAAAANAKQNGTIIYSIGYDLNGSGTDYERCRLSTGQVDGTITAWDAIRAIASDPTHFYNKPDPGQLNTIFRNIAADLQRPAARLIDDNTQ